MAESAWDSIAIYVFQLQVDCVTIGHALHKAG